MSLDPKCKERRDRINTLRKRGNYIRNSQGFFKPVRSPVLKDRNSLPCSNCLGFYSSKLLYRHRKKCAGGSTVSAQADGQNNLINNIAGRIDTRLKNEVFPRMQPDKISMEAKKDPLICAFGAQSQYLKIHREKHFINVTSRKMRELSRLLLALKEKEPKITSLFDALRPEYNLICDAVKSVAKYGSINDSFASPTYARNIGTALKQCCDIAILHNLTSQNSVSSAETEVKLKNMIHLFTSSWRFEISSQAGTDFNMKKWNKITIVPLAEDLKILKQYLISKAKTVISSLRSDPHDKIAYKILLETIYCRIILLNRKRPGELQRLLLQTYLNSEAKEGTSNYEEFDPIVSSTEKVLLKNFKRIVIRGKRGGGVAVLFSKDVQEHIDILLSVRKNLVDVRNPYLFGRPVLPTPVIGYKVLQGYARASGAKNPSAITCTRLRKYLATLSQLFSLNETEVDQLVTFMGHTIGVHKNSYRLPDDIHQTAKISKLLLLLEGGNLQEFKGKTLDEIGIDLEEDLLEQTNSKESDDDKSNSDDDIIQNFSYSEQSLPVEKPQTIRTGAMEMVNDETKRQPKKRTLVKWTSQQKKIVKKFFQKHIMNKIPPKKAECDLLKSKYPEVLENKDWLKIKVFIQNIYSGKQKNCSDEE
ncbi:uncharacterized protein LOC123321723 [Coccinella septempunctata]|uniref:uncharacterized protein LOC123321723 n=1 Tax=Coccinella septempunctata TaxID=41139 RepID=UPI001D081DB0|nr:uncharacterized protein LOC123321723 [Coccinella septempunctata]